MAPGGFAVNPRGGKVFSWDVFDKTRSIAQGRPPGTGPAMIAPQKVGVVNASAYRAHEAIHLQEERIFRMRPLGGQWGLVDSRGQSYVASQAQYQAQRFRNNREFMVSRMMRGGFDIKISGDNWVPVDSGDGHITVDLQLPAANKGNLGGIIDAGWNLTTTDILGQILAINAKFEEDHGYPLRHVWVDSGVYNLMLNNDSLKNVAGTANTVFTQFEPTGIRNVEGIEDTGFDVVFRAIPWLQVHVYDARLDVDGTSKKIIEPKHAYFTADPDSNIAEWLEASEVVAENVMDPGREAFGMVSWVTRVIDPAGFELKTLDGGMTALYLPKCVADATVDLS